MNNTLYLNNQDNMTPENTPIATEIKAAEIILHELLRLHSEEELMRLAYRAKKARQLWLHDIIQAELRDRTPE